MNKLSLFFYSLNVIVTSIAFYVINFLTEPVLIGSSENNISNGNPGLFPLVFLMPFLIVSIIGTFKIAYSFAKRTYKTMQYKIIIIFSFLLSSIIYFFTFKEARKFRLLVFENNDSVTKITQIPLLNTYSNNIFFNGWTLLALLFTTVFIAYCFALVKQRDTR
ncbi:hypothetical protein [Lysinibacillus capsici]|uniref:hypothetical protein n=1 Tax=Lysinibacillus capsici TaxID=2115968 RepID=UPI0028ADB85F|nr:hypothetical protein [Lysinibacillus capsici]